MGKRNIRKFITIFATLSVVGALLFLLIWRSFEGPPRRTLDSSAQRQFAQQFETPEIQWLAQLQTPDLEYGKYPFLIRFLLNDLLSWTPTGQRQVYSPGCEPKLWAQRLMDPRLKNIQLQGALLQKYFQDCEAELVTGLKSDTLNSLRFLTIGMDVANHPFLNRVQFNLPRGIKLQGLLALKGDLKARPLVVMRMGIYTNVEEAIGERFLMMSWFEQGPFNVLFLDNMTGALFVDQNKQVSFGGYDEALQNIQIARFLRDPKQPLSRLVSSVHFAGLSLGGNGVIYSSLLNEHNPFLGKRLINSFLGLCPVVSLKDSLERLTAPGLHSAVIDFWSQRRLAGVAARLDQKPATFQFLPSLVETVVGQYRGGLTWDGSVALPRGLQNSADFWRVNDFLPRYRDVEAPVLSFVTRKDDLVPAALNSERLKASNFRMVKLNEGFHCTLPAAYHWDVWPHLFNAYFLSHSPEVKMQKTEIPVPVVVDKSGHALKFEVLPLQQERFVRLKLHGPFESKEIHLPLNGFDFTFHNSQLSVPEKEMLVRWLNQNIQLSIVGNDLIVSWTTWG